MRILLLGARGQLGRALFSVLNHDCPHWPVVAPGRGESDIADPGKRGLLTESITVSPISSAQWPQSAPRPLNFRLDCRLLSTVFGIRLPSWQEQMAIWLASQGADLVAEDVRPSHELPLLTPESPMTQRKGIILTGGSATRLYPVTLTISKHCCPSMTNR